MPEAQIAARLRDIARAYEQGDGFVAGGAAYVSSQYSCNAVYYGFNRSSEMQRRYADLFGLSVDNNQWWLWHHRSNGSRRNLKGRTDLRILMLCFAAAMAETGDL